MDFWLIILPLFCNRSSLSKAKTASCETNTMNHPFLLLLFSGLFTPSLGAIVEEWQTVFPATSCFLPLFGLQSPAWWRVYSEDGNYEAGAQVPGDIMSDLMRAGIIDEPYMDRNFLTQCHVWMGPSQQFWNNNLQDPFHLEQRSQIWVYKCSFEMTPTTNDWCLFLKESKWGQRLRSMGSWLVRLQINSFVAISSICVNTWKKNHLPWQHK